MATEQVAEQVAEHLEEVAEVTRHIDPRLVRYFLGGVGVGAAIGFFIGYRYNRQKIRAEAFEESEAEIKSIREHYQQKATAAENASDKASLVGIVVEEGYADKNMIDLDALRERSERLAHPPVPVQPAKRIFRSSDQSKDKWTGWNWPSEMTKRSSDRPYIIHQDEFAKNETEFSQTTYVYYAEDNVLVDEDERILVDTDELVGKNFANRFGHGTDDFNILYVRNPRLELEMEICRSPGSYEVEVLGLEPDVHDDDST